MLYKWHYTIPNLFGSVSLVFWRFTKKMKLFIINNILSKNNVQLHKHDFVSYGTELGKVLYIFLKRCIQRVYSNDKYMCHYEK